jgi:hypothetical protein
MQYIDIKITETKWKMWVWSERRSQAAVVFWDVTSCSVVKNTALSKGLTASH